MCLVFKVVIKFKTKVVHTQLFLDFLLLFSFLECFLCVSGLRCFLCFESNWASRLILSVNISLVIDFSLKNSYTLYYYGPLSAYLSHEVTHCFSTISICHNFARDTSNLFQSFLL